MVYAKTKSQIGCTITMQLIGNFIFDRQIPQALIALNPEFQASNILNSLVCVGPGRKHKQKREFSRDRYSNNQNKLLYKSILTLDGSKVRRVYGVARERYRDEILLLLFYIPVTFRWKAH